MNLGEFYDYKNKLAEDLLTNDKIVELIDDSVADPATLSWTKVFPLEYVPETVENASTFICFDVDIQKSINKTFYLPTIYIWVFTHKSLIRLPEGGVRVDKLVSEIASTINGSRYYGLGELDLWSVKRFAPMTDYQGKIMTFQAKEFNRLSPTGMAVPAKRGSG